MINIAICEQDVNTRNMCKVLIEEAVKEFGLDHVFHDFSDFNALTEALKSKNMTVLLLSTNIGGVLGVDYAKALREKGNKSVMLFISDTAEYALSSFDVAAFFYFLKPPEKERFKFVFKRLFNFIAPKNKQTVVLKSNNEYVSYRIKNIVYVASEGHRIIIRLADGTDHEYFMKLDDFEKLLNSPFFIRIHKSYLVNGEYASSINATVATVNGENLPVSRSLKNEAIAKFTKIKAKG